MRRLASHGQDPAADVRPFGESPEAPAWFRPMVELGYNYRLTELQAALGLSQLARLDGFVSRRAELAARYAGELPDALALPEPAPGHAWHLYVVRAAAQARDDLLRFLAERGIRAQVHYYPVPLQPYFRARLAPRAYPAAEAHARTGLSLPLFPAMTGLDQTRVVAALREYFA
jgi:dTDP-4-amino-4,6-dideoxygalactose transaminase